MSVATTLLSNVKAQFRTIPAFAIKMSESVFPSADLAAAKPAKLFGRAFYESIGSPKMIVAPMVDRSEFAWRLLTRSYLDDQQSKSLLAYTPMLHARLFKDGAKFRDDHFQPTRASLTSTEKSPAEPWLDGNPQNDRPLFVQFCANKPEDLLEAARYVAPYCDAVDLNLGCPQGIARAGHYGAFLQEHWDTIYSMINKLHNELSIPVTAKMRILETKEKTLDYAKMILSAGASILTVHGRRREQKGHNMGIADWEMIRYLRDNLPPETVLFANGNILNSGDLEKCLEATGADGIMSAEGNLSDPTIFAKPPSDSNSRDYWTGKDGKAGYRLDAVFRRYMDIIYQHVLDQNPPTRAPLYIPGDEVTPIPSPAVEAEIEVEEQPRGQKRKREITAKQSPNLKSMQGHLFQLLRPMLSIHTNIRDALAKARAGDIPAFERILTMVEEATRKGLDEEAVKNKSIDDQSEIIEKVTDPNIFEAQSEAASSKATIAKYSRPYWVCQPYIRPLPEEAIKIGSMTLSKKERAKLDAEKKTENVSNAVSLTDDQQHGSGQSGSQGEAQKELPKEALVCG